MKRFFISFVGVLFFVNSYSNEYFVSKSGSDTNTGTEASPFLTISKAAEVMVAGDICYIKEGIYRETLLPQNNGNSNASIKFVAFGQDSVVISATEEIIDWTVHSGNVYKSSVNIPLGVERNMLYFNNNPMDIARWPNNVDNDRFTPDYNYVSGGSGSHIEFSGIPSIDWSDGYIWYLGAHSGASWTRKITSSTSSRVDFIGVDITKWPFNPHNPTVLRNEHRGIFYLFGRLEALDFEREWYFDSATEIVYFQAPENSNPATGTTEYSAREHTIHIISNYIEVEGLTTFGGSVLIEGNNCKIKNLQVSHGFQSLDELDNTDAQIVSGAISVEGDNNSIEDCIIDGSSGNGIGILTAWKGTKNNTIKNNIVRNINTIGIHSNAIRSNCTGTIIQNNTIYTCGRDGIYVSGSESDISYNNVYDCMKINNDGGVFYTVGNDLDKNSKIHHNWFHDSEGPEYADGRAAGIYLDNHSKGYDVHHNVVWNVTWTGIQLNWDNWNLNILNNSLWDIEGAMGRWENGYTLDNVLVKNNFASSGEWIGTEITTNTVLSASPFVAVSDNNFNPAEGSFLIDRGEIIEGITDGFFGDAPDLGAYERGTEYWLPGVDWLDISPPSFIEEVFIEQPKIRFYPNPVIKNAFILIEVEKPIDAYVRVYNSNGILCHKEVINNLPIGVIEKEISFTHLERGVYFVKLRLGNEIYIEKIIKE